MNSRLLIRTVLCYKQTCRLSLLKFSKLVPKRYCITTAMQPPKVKRDESIVEDLHGVQVVDPYRWLEDPDSEETKAFVNAQNEYSSAYIESCPIREKIREKLTKIWNYPKYSCPYKRGDKYFYFMNSGLQNQSVMYYQNSIDDDEATTFLDPNKLSETGTVAISSTAFSEDGKIFAYSLSENGSDWVTIHFKNVDTMEDYPDKLEKVKFSSISWTHDHKGIFYACYPEQTGKGDGSETDSNVNQKIYYHKLGQDQSKDVLVVEFPDNPKWLLDFDVSECGKYLIMMPRLEITENLIYYSVIPKDINAKLDLTCVVDTFDASYEFITNDGTECLFRTNKDASNFCLIKIDLMKPNPENWKTLVKEHPKNVLDWTACVDNDKLVVCYMEDVKNVLEIRSLKHGGLIYKVPLEIGSISGYSGKRKQSEMFYSFISFLSPGTIYHLDFSKEPLQPKVFRQIEIDGFDHSLFESHQVFYPSKDGTMVPMFIVHRKDFQKGSKVPVLLYGYGGFNISITPQFSISRILFMQMLKGVIAVPNIRGGGEYGKSWHNAGRTTNKQNVFDDFQCAAEYLIKENYGTNKTIVINGYSNGGLLVGACLNQRPDLFGAAVAGVGVFDMLRFHKFTIGYAWCGDYGDPDQKKHFEYNIKYSPLHNVKPPAEGVQYPPTLLLTADHDDRVVPLHSLKMISELQYRISALPWQKNPLYIRIETKAGHGGGKPTSQKISEVVDTYAFIVNALGLETEQCSD